ncbi:MAG: rRNA maturation RNase YbeY [Bacillota bacterium]
MELIIENRQDKIQVAPEMENIVKEVAAQVLKQENLSIDPEVSIIFVDDRIIKEMNLLYRGIDESTDVLSFSMREEVSDEYPSVFLEEDNLLGDVVISLETAQRQSDEYGHSLDREIGFLTVHGILHLLGYDHINKEDAIIMRKKEEDILIQLGLKR